MSERPLTAQEVDDLVGQLSIAAPLEFQARADEPEQLFQAVADGPVKITREFLMDTGLQAVSFGLHLAP